MASKKSDINAAALITEFYVLSTLKDHKGDNASLETFDLEDLERQGHNFGSKLTRVNLKYRLKKSSDVVDLSYVVKLYSTTDAAAQKILKSFFDAEINFYRDLLPKLNEGLESIGEPALKVPNVYKCVQLDGGSMIFMEDLCPDFRVHVTTKGLDEAHINLIIQELARFHASSKLFFTKQGVAQRDLDIKYPVLKGRRADEIPLCTELMREYLMHFAEIIRPLSEYDFITSYIESTYAEKGEDGFKFCEDWRNMMDNTETTFTIRHGDCWTENMLFKYSDSGVPEDIRLFDFQLVGKGSPVLDLMNVLYPCVDAKYRQAMYSEFLSAYYETFQSISKKGDTSVPFTSEELTKEFEDKWQYGFVMTISLVPFCYIDAKFSPDIILMLKDESLRSEILQKYLSKVGNITRAHVNVRPRILDMFDYLFERGLLDKKE